MKKYLSKLLNPTVISGTFAVIGISVGTISIFNYYNHRGQYLPRYSIFDDNCDGRVSDEELRRHHPSFREKYEEKLEDTLVYNQIEN